MNAQPIKTAMDAQIRASTAIMSFADRDDFKNIKDDVYTSPRYKETNSEGIEISTALNLASISDVIGIYLRDKYLEKYPHLVPGKNSPEYSLQKTLL